MPRYDAANFARRQNSAQSASRSAWSFALNSSNTNLRIRASALRRKSGRRSLYLRLNCCAFNSLIR